MANEPRKELTITRIFDAPGAMVWKAWPDPEIVGAFGSGLVSPMIMLVGLFLESPDRAKPIHVTFTGVALD